MSHTDDNTTPIPLHLYPPNSDNILTSSKWYISDPTRFSVPKFKQCKDKEYSEDFQSILYKVPYKYAMSVSMTKRRANVDVSTSTMTDEDERKEGAHVLMMQLLYENLEEVNLDVGKSAASGKKGRAKRGATTPVTEPLEQQSVQLEVANADKSTETSTEVLSGSVAVFRDLLMKDCKEAVFGNLSFNSVCSYKLGGRDFRLCLYVVELPVDLSLEEFEKRMKYYDPRNSIPLSAGSRVIGKLISPSFTIRAKKPSTRNKRKATTSASNTKPGKKQKTSGDTDATTNKDITSIVEKVATFSDTHRHQLLSALMAQASDHVKGMILREWNALLYGAGGGLMAGAPQHQITMQNGVMYHVMPPHHFMPHAGMNMQRDTGGSSDSDDSEGQGHAPNATPLDTSSSTNTFDFGMEVDETLFFHNQL